MTDTKQASEKLVRDFLGSWEGRDLETICGAFADDAVYHNAPVEADRGHRRHPRDLSGVPRRVRRSQARCRHAGGRTGPGARRARRLLHHERRHKGRAPRHRRVRRQEWRNHALHRLFRSRGLRTPERVQAVSHRQPSPTWPATPPHRHRTSHPPQRGGVWQDLVVRASRKGGVARWSPPSQPSSAGRRTARSRSSSRPFDCSSIAAFIRSSWRTSPRRPASPHERCIATTTTSRLCSPRPSAPARSSTRAPACSPRARRHRHLGR